MTKSLEKGTCSCLHLKPFGQLTRFDATHKRKLAKHFRINKPNLEFANKGFDAA